MKFTREGKTDFTEHYKRHKEVLQKHGCDVDALIQLRQHFHKFPEGHFKEVKTRAQDKFGRNPDHLKVMPGLSCYVGRTEDEAKAARTIAERIRAAGAGIGETGCERRDPRTRRRQVGPGRERLAAVPEAVAPRPAPEPARMAMAMPTKAVTPKLRITS